MKKLSIALVVWSLGATAGCQARTSHDKLPETARVVLDIDQDRSLTLNRKPVSRAELAKEWARLAGETGEKAKDAGMAIDGIEGLPAVIVIWAADATPCSVVYSILREAQQRGFRRWVFFPKSRHGDPFILQFPSKIGTRAKPTDLPELVCTIPIVLRAGDQGDIVRLMLGEVELENFRALQSELGKFQDDPEAPFDRALLRTDPTLKFSELARVTDLLQKHRIATMAFDEVTLEDG